MDVFSDKKKELFEELARFLVEFENLARIGGVLEGTFKERKRIRKAVEGLIEQLAELEHEQWMKWASAVMSEVSRERQQRWKRYMIPYNQLADDVQEHDRVWARKVIELVVNAIEEAEKGN